MIGRLALKTSATSKISPYHASLLTHRRFLSNYSKSEKASSSSSFDSSSSGAVCPYTILGISKNSNASAVKAAYRVKCQTEHPDVGGSDEAFRRINWAYEECTRRVQERENLSNNDSSKNGNQSHASPNGRTGAWSRWDASEDDRSEPRTEEWYETLAEHHRAMRKTFYDAFPRAQSSEEIDDLLFGALSSQCFNTIDVGEPLALALRHYHAVTGYGAPHLERCFHAIDRWEVYTKRRVGVTHYHSLLILYTDGPKPGLTASIISESVEAVMEQMCTKGIEYDDWTLTLAHKAFRIAPYPTW